MNAISDQDREAVSRRSPTRLCRICCDSSAPGKGGGTYHDFAARLDVKWHVGDIS